MTYLFGPLIVLYFLFMGFVLAPIRVFMQGPKEILALEEKIREQNEVAGVTEDFEKTESDRADCECTGIAGSSNRS